MKKSLFSCIITLLLTSNSSFAQEDYFEPRHLSGSFLRDGGFAVTANLLDIGLIGGINFERSLLEKYSIGVGLGSFFNESADSRINLLSPTVWLFVSRYDESGRFQSLWGNHKLAIVRYQTMHGSTWYPVYTGSLYYGAPETGFYAHAGLNISPYFLFIPLPTLGAGFRF